MRYADVHAARLEDPAHLRHHLGHKVEVVLPAELRVEQRLGGKCVLIKSQYVCDSSLQLEPSRTSNTPQMGHPPLRCGHWVDNTTHTLSITRSKHPSGISILLTSITVNSISSLSAYRSLIWLITTGDVSMHVRFTKPESYSSAPSRELPQPGIRISKF